MGNNQKIKYYSNRIETILNGEPWFGRSVFSILPEIHPAEAYQKPNAKENAHSLIDLLYHIITWTEYTLGVLTNGNSETGKYEELNWRFIDPKIHTWTNGMEELRKVSNELLEFLKKSEDNILEKPVPGKNFNTEYLLNGWIDHTIYHLGQIAYVKKWH